MSSVQKISPCLWFDDQAEAAARFYTALFPNSRIVDTARYGEAGQEFHRKPVGSVMTVSFELDGLAFTALNGGPLFQFSEAISFQVSCGTQAEIDHYWDGLLAGGGRPQQCGWLKDRFGVSWQVVPEALPALLAEADPETATRVMTALFQMVKPDLAALEAAAAVGVTP